MILLSALLASLTGLVAGERPVARAQVELSAVATAIQPAATVSRSGSAMAVSQPVTVARVSAPVETVAAVATLPTGTFLAIKQSWLL